jgi:hypothetical protein
MNCPWRTRLAIPRVPDEIQKETLPTCIQEFEHNSNSISYLPILKPWVTNEIAPKRMACTKHYFRLSSLTNWAFGGQAAKGLAGKEFRQMELCYLVSISELQEILQSEAKPNTLYALMARGEKVTVVHFGQGGLIHQFAFPIVHRMPGVPEAEGTLMLLVATERSPDWQSFWRPLKNKLLHCCSLSTIA